MVGRFYGNTFMERRLAGIVFDNVFGGRYP